MYRSQRTKSAISPIIATLLLILIAIASGVVLYTYVLGFLGNSTQNSGLTTSTISIDNACASVTNHCNNNGYSVTIRNMGTNSISGTGSIQIYFTDVSTSATATTICQISSSGIPPDETITCPTTSAAFPLSPPSANQGDSIQIKVVMPDGGSAVTSTRLMS